jgi:hypothetical protein
MKERRKKEKIVWSEEWLDEPPIPPSLNNKEGYPKYYFPTISFFSKLNILRSGQGKNVAHNMGQCCFYMSHTMHINEPFP